MSSKSAFPGAYKECEHGRISTEYNQGMSLRDYFAAQALPALIKAETEAERTGSTNPRRHFTCAYEAYKYADAMLDESICKR